MRLRRGKVPAVGRMPGGCSLMTEPWPAICRASRRCTAGPGSSRPPPTTATLSPAGLQGGQVSGTIDAHGQPGDDGDASLREASTDARGQAATDARGVPRADDGDEAGCHQARRGAQPEDDGRRLLHLVQAGRPGAVEGRQDPAAEGQHAPAPAARDRPP